MPTRSKWQQLPTEAINPASIGIDKLGTADIVDTMLNEDRKMLAAVSREKERIALGARYVNTVAALATDDAMRDLAPNALEQIDDATVFLNLIGTYEQKYPQLAW